MINIVLILYLSLSHVQAGLLKVFLLRFVLWVLLGRLEDVSCMHLY